MGEQGIHGRSRWRTDGSHYHSILRDGEREAAGSEGEITMEEKEGESEYGVRLKKNILIQAEVGGGGGRESIDMLLWCLRGERWCCGSDIAEPQWCELQTVNCNRLNNREAKFQASF